jgi:hypothetical protein
MWDVLEMLKQIFSQTLSGGLQSRDKLIESSTITVDSGIDPEVELVLPLLGAKEEEYDDYRFILKQLKRRNIKAFNKISNLD